MPQDQRDQYAGLVRRTDEMCPPGSEDCPTAKAMHLRVTNLERKCSEMSTAFVLNDLRTPDFDGHRKSHLDIEETARVMKNYKISATQKVIGAVVAIAILLLSTGTTTKVLEVVNRVAK